MASRTLAIILAGSSRGAERALGATDRALGRTESKIRSVVKAAAVVGGVFATAFLAATKSASGLETSNVKLQTQLGLTAEAAAAVRSEVIALSRETGRGAVELSEASFAIQSAGLRGQKASEVLAASAKLAALGLGETRDIALATGAALTAYKGTTLTAADASDVLLATVKEGNLEASELAGSLGQALPVASNLGVSFAELGASIAVYTRLGLSASEATTGVRAAMSALFNPSVRARQSLEDVGLSASDLQALVDERGLGGALQVLRDRLNDDVKFAKLLSSSEALGFALSVTNENAEEFQRTLASVRDSAGATDEAFGIVAETTEFQFKRALADLNALVLDIGANLLPLANELIGFVSEVAAELTDFAAAIGLVDSSMERLLKSAGFSDEEIGGLVGSLLSHGEVVEKVRAVADGVNDLTNKLSGGLVPAVRTEKEILEDKIELLAQTEAGHRAITDAIAGNDTVLRLLITTLSDEEIQARVTAEANEAAAASVDEVPVAINAAVPVVQQGADAIAVASESMADRVATSSVRISDSMRAVQMLFAQGGDIEAGLPNDIMSQFPGLRTKLFNVRSRAPVGAAARRATGGGAGRSAAEREREREQKQAERERERIKEERKIAEAAKLQAAALAVGQAAKYATALELEGAKRDQFIEQWRLAEQADRDLKHADELAYYRREETDAAAVLKLWQELKDDDETKKLAQEAAKLADARADSQAARFATALELEGNRRQEFIEQWQLAEQADRDLKRDDELAYYRREETDAAAVLSQWQAQKERDDQREEDQKKRDELLTKQWDEAIEVSRGIREAAAALRKRADEAARRARARAFASTFDQLNRSGIRAETAVRVARFHADEAAERESRKLLGRAPPQKTEVEIKVRGEGALADVINERVNISLQDGTIVVGGNS